MFEELFLDRHFNHEHARIYGFVPVSSGWQMNIPVQNGSFSLQVQISKDGLLSHTLFSCPDGEQYILYRTAAGGPFVNSLRKEIQNILADIAHACFDPLLFFSAQAKRVAAYIQQQYDRSPSFPFSRYPHIAVFRHADNQKWFALLMPLAKDVLHAGKKTPYEILTLNADEKHVCTYRKTPGIYPGYHMNKTYWYSIIMDESLTDSEIRPMLEESYQRSLSPRTAPK